MSKKKVVIVGGGFAGINLAKNLDSNFFDILLIDKLNHHQFQPLFYQVATSQIEPSSISFPLRYIFRKNRNVRIRMAKAVEVLREEKILRTNMGDYPYDFLVLAMGCTTHYFGNEGIKKHALGLKSTYDAISIRNHILGIFEKLITAEADEKKALLNIVVVGGGPTGVELAGAFAEIKNTLLPIDYHRIDFSELKIWLMEGSGNTLNNMSDKSKKYSRKFLENLGVEIHTNTIVNDYDGELLIYNKDQQLFTKTVVWAAGVTAFSLEGIKSDEIGRANRIKVDRFNRILHQDPVYVLGDQSIMETPIFPNGHPQLANVANQQAQLLAKNLKRLLQGKELVPYEYKDLGSMATVGKNKAVVDLPFWSFQGLFAWLVWMFLHLMLILSVRNKLIIFVNWTWAYFKKNTALRIILKGSEE
jgi:NADH:ubiquinone reductase (H+-translocating)